MKTHLFDLDGTLTDPKAGITRCIQFALERLGAATPPAEELLWCIGPPLSESFAKLLSPELASQAVALYRERFSEIGWRENERYDGIAECLGALRETGARLFVATSKPHLYARKILEHFELAPFFEATYGAELDGTRGKKGELIRYLLAEEKLQAEHVTMIGDREHDVHGARQNQIPCIGVTWGYGSAEELTKAGAAQLCASPADLLALLHPARDG
ncbi:MAG: HAD family hydrolase [Bdellovibrionota bacterium]